jgi:hypothetical protein
MISVPTGARVRCQLVIAIERFHLDIAARSPVNLACTFPRPGACAPVA